MNVNLLVFMAAACLPAASAVSARDADGKVREAVPYAEDGSVEFAAIPQTWGCEVWVPR